MSTVDALPHPPLRELPGLFRRMFVDPVPVLEDLANRHGPNFSIGGGPVRMAVVGEPAAMREMFAMSTDQFRWAHKFNLLGFIVGKESMLVSDGAAHKRRRSSVQGAFSRRRLNGWIPMIVERTDAAINRVIADLGASSETVDLYGAGRSLLFELAVRSFFGERLAGRSVELSELFRRSQDYIESPAARQIPHPFPGTKRAKVRQDRRAIDAIIDEQIAHLRTKSSDDPLDVLASLVREGDLSDSEIRDQVVTLIGAGFDTTSASLAWMFWCISLEPGLWGRLRAEADTVFGPLDQPATADAETPQRLDLANRTMREALRLHPAAVVSPREATEDMVVGGYSIPKGTLLFWSAHLAGRDPSAWPDPLRFDPDRFVDPPAEAKALADIAWVPFGRGARNCIGFALAQMELTLIISRMAQRLDIAAESDQIPQPIGMVVNRPTGGAHMKVRPRV